MERRLSKAELNLLLEMIVSMPVAPAAYSDGLFRLMRRADGAWVGDRVAERYFDLVDLSLFRLVCVWRASDEIGVVRGDS